MTCSINNGVIEVNKKNKIFDKLIKCSNDINENIRLANIFDDEKLIKLLEYEDTILNGQINEEELKLELTDIYEESTDEINKFFTKYQTLPVVNPTKQKFKDTVFQQHYYQLLRMLSFELEKPDSVLIVFGFSFADEHILEIVRRSIVNPKLKIYVIAFDNDAKSVIEGRLGNLGGNIIEYLPSKNLPDGSQVYGNFTYLNSLFDGKVEENN